MNFSTQQTQGNETTNPLPGTGINDVSQPPPPRDEFEHLPSNVTEAPPSPGGDYSVPGIGVRQEVSTSLQPEPSDEVEVIHDAMEIPIIPNEAEVVDDVMRREVSPSSEVQDRNNVESNPGFSADNPLPPESSADEPLAEEYNGETQPSLEEPLEECEDDIEKPIIPEAEPVNDTRADLENRLARLNEVVLAYQNSVVAEIVEHQPSPSSSDAVNPVARKTKCVTLLAILLFLVVIIVTVTVTLYFSKKTRDQPSPTWAPTIASTFQPTRSSAIYTTMNPTVAPTFTPRRFKDLETLKKAVDEYLDRDGDVLLIGDWDVSEVTAMDHLFSADRNDRLVIFNEDISSWNMANVRNASNMFRGATRFNQNLSMWNTSQIQDMSSMFKLASSFNGDVSNWDVSRVRSMFDIFADAIVFNQPMTLWDTGNVENMWGAFGGALAFNSDISSWNVSNVRKFYVMFYGATNFGIDLSSWDVGNALNTGFMFYQTKFNADISQWDVRRVTTMTAMFYEAKEFNQDISPWNISHVTDLSYMFLNAIAFNADISPWNVSNVTTMEGMFNGATSFNQDLCAWSTMLNSNMTTTDIFGGTSCPFTENITVMPPIHMCQSCS